MSYTKENLKNFLDNKFPGRELFIEFLSDKNGHNSFKVGVPLDIKEKFKDPSMWPEGIHVADLFFRRETVFTKTGKTSTRGRNTRPNLYRGQYPNSKFEHKKFKK